MNRTLRILGIAILATLALGAMSACAAPTATPTAPPAPTATPTRAPTPTPTRVPAANISVQNPWVRPVLVSAGGAAMTTPMAAGMTTPTPMTMATPTAMGGMTAPTAVAGMMATPAAIGGMMTTPMAMGAGVNTAAYMVLVNTGNAPDALLEVMSDVADKVELHETTMVNGVMAMSPVPQMEVPAGGQFELKPAGYHIMMRGVRHSLAPGDKVLLVLRFKNSGEMTVTAEVRAP